jgi:cytochrome c oxidase subunit IV
MSDQSKEKHHIISYKENFGTWLGLMLLTALTVAVSVVNASLVTLTVVTALVIATTKAILVAYYYMHLKFDHKIYRIMLLIITLLFTSFMLLTVFDYISR